MEDHIKQILEVSKTMETLRVEKENMRMRFRSKLYYQHDDGEFEVTPQLIAFVKTELDQDQKELILLDENNFPVFVEDIEDFYDEIRSIYFEATQSYANEYKELRRKRTPQKLLDMEE